jgi:hypothetical protein
MVGRRIKALAAAMAEMEGWNPPIGGKAGLAGNTIAYRYHNPLNLRASPLAVGVQNGFAVFYDDQIGMVAGCWDIMQKAKGNTVTGLNGESTLEQLIGKWAPPSENNTDEYLDFISMRTGFPATMRLKELLAD